MSCTGEKSRNLEWFITLPDSNPHRHHFFYEQVIEYLNNHSFYEMPEIINDMGRTIQPLISSTEGENGSVIECVDIGLSLIINKTIIMVSILV